MFGVGLTQLNSTQLNSLALLCFVLIMHKPLPTPTHGHSGSGLNVSSVSYETDRAEPSEAKLGCHLATFSYSHSANEQLVEMFSSCCCASCS
ncbi:MAG: hypothetical protein K6253_01350, partial [Candidatus Liberibacter asiaticus]|nr:hypothetical protein [Candidatus Liberibacter asiaticus]